MGKRDRAFTSGAAAILLWLMVAGCELGVTDIEVTDGQHDEECARLEDGIFNEECALRAVRSFRVRGFERITASPFSSGVTGLIEVSVASEAAAAYRRIVPNGPPETISLPLGSLIIREVLDDQGNVVKLTVIGQGPAGYNPDVSDFWFAVTDPSGNVLTVNDERQLGALVSCQGCHVAQRSNSYLFGVPLSARAGAVRP